MINAMKHKIVAITPPGAIVDAGSFTCASVDTKGWDWCTIIILLGATDIAMAALKLQHADADSAHADITGGSFASATMTNGSAAALPAASGATGDNTMHAIQVDCRNVKRFLKLVATAGDGSAGTYMTAFAILSRGKEAPNSLTERGFAQEIAV
jgi:hypothetical protein